MRDRLQYLIWTWLGVLWTTGAVAAQTTFANDITSIPPGAIAVAMLLAFIGGAAYTTSKVANPTVVVASVPLEIVKDIMSSLVAGLVTFFAGAYLGWSPFLQALCITVAGYGGSRVLEAAVGQLISRMGAVFGASKT
jgi:hypothetical protein